jgi:ATP-dependent DNA ligase
MKTWPTLYKKTSTGALQGWTIIVDGNTIRTRFGQTGGAIQTSEPTRCEEKNVGRSNATTAEEQALLEAQSQWEKKCKKDYTTTPAKAMAGEASDLIDGGLLPMLAHKFSEHGDKAQWPAYAQRKLDGTRCIAIVDRKGKCTLWSRTRKPIRSMPHIVAAIEAQKTPGTILDGELFATDFHSRFEELISLIRSSGPKSNCTEVQYWVYDAIYENIPFEERVGSLTGLHAPLVPVETVLVNNETEMRELFAQYVGEGFEGLMLRNRKGLYVGRRSTDLLKVKERDDAEFVIVGMEEGRGKLTGHGILELATPEGKKFRAKMQGNIGALRDLWENQKKYIGKQATVTYQGLTADGIPRFPVALRVCERL